MKSTILACLLSAVALLTTVNSTQATPLLTIGDSHELGFVNFGIPASDADRVAYVNHLIGMSLGSNDTGLGQTFFRSNNSFSPLNTAVWASNGTSTTINLGTTGYEYLLAKYDGPNYGSEVWYIGGLTGSITIPATAGTQGYGLSGWTLFTPAQTPSVPDGGSTVAFLGLALVGVEGLRRIMIRKAASVH